MFVGRDNEIRELRRRLGSRDGLDSSRVVSVSGPSGSGKSSLVRSGLRARLEYDEEWLTLEPIEPDIGRVRLVLFQRRPWARHGIAAASAGDSTPWLVGSADTPTTFDVIVRGLRSESSYTIYGYWYEGTGGGC